MINRFHKMHIEYQTCDVHIPPSANNPLHISFNNAQFVLQISNCMSTMEVQQLHIFFFHEINAKRILFKNKVASIGSKLITYRFLANT